MLNPQYHLQIYSDVSRHAGGRSTKAITNVTVKSDRHMPLNASIVWSQGQRVTEFVLEALNAVDVTDVSLRIVNNNVAASSGPYKYGYTTLSRELQRETSVGSAFVDAHNHGSW